MDIHLDIHYNKYIQYDKMNMKLNIHIHCNYDIFLFELDYFHHYNLINNFYLNHNNYMVKDNFHNKYHQFYNNHYNYLNIFVYYINNNYMNQYKFYYFHNDISH